MVEENENVENEEVLETEETEESQEVTPDDVSAIKQALKKANKEAAKYRHELKELRQERESEQERAVREAQEAVKSEVEGKYKTLLVNTAAKARLAEAGVQGSSEKLVRLIDFDAVTVNENGEIEGLDEQVKSIKKDFPELFDKTRRAPAVDTGPKEPSNKKLTSAEKLAKQVRGE